MFWRGNPHSNRVGKVPSQTETHTTHYTTCRDMLKRHIDTITVYRIFKNIVWVCVIFFRIVIAFHHDVFVQLLHPITKYNYFQLTGGVPPERSEYKPCINVWAKQKNPRYMVIVQWAQYSPTKAEYLQGRCQIAIYGYLSKIMISVQCHLGNLGIYR